MTVRFHGLAGGVENEAAYSIIGPSPNGFFNDSDKFAMKKNVNREVENKVETGASQFLARTAVGVLTPHPGPLPVEGRGSRGARA